MQKKLKITKKCAKKWGKNAQNLHVQKKKNEKMCKRNEKNLRKKMHKLCRPKLTENAILGSFWAKCQKLGPKYHKKNLSGVHVPHLGRSSIKNDERKASVVQLHPTAHPCISFRVVLKKTKLPLLFQHIQLKIQKKMDKKQHS